MINTYTEDLINLENLEDPTNPTGSVKSGDLRINDLYFYIPPEAISIITTEYDESAFLLREAIPGTAKKGRKKISVHIPLAIDISSTGYSQVSKLLIQIRKSPIITIENEKLRTELLGSNVDNSTSIALLVDNITGSIDREFPSLLRIDLQMTWFNYLPYSPNLLYRNIKDSQERAPTKAPGTLFEKFYNEGTLINGKLINDPTRNLNIDPEDPTGTFLEDSISIYYKEYRNFPEAIDVAFSENTSKMEQRSKVFNSQVISKLREQSWIPAAQFYGYDDIDDVFYRWRKINVPTIALKESGALILEDLSFSLSTNISYIPLQGYSIPTAQFMGGSIAQLRAIIFAAAEYSKEGVPSATSKRLGHLQNIFDAVSEVRFQYRKYAKEDYVLIEHPISKLLKYKPYTEKRSLNDSICYIDEENPRVIFDYNDLLPVVPSNRSSRTVEGLPFASRIQIDMKETRIREDNEMIRVGGDSGKLSRASYKEAWENTLLKVYETFEIGIKDRTSKPNQFIVKSNIQSPDRIIANKMAEVLSRHFYIFPEEETLDQIFASERFNQASDKLVKTARKRLALNTPRNTIERENTYRKTLSELKQLKGGYNFDKMKAPFFNSETASALVSELVFLIRKSEKYEPTEWPERYREILEPILNYSYIPFTSTFQDLMIPRDWSSPTYHFQSWENQNIFRANAIRGCARISTDIDQVLIDQFKDTKAPDKLEVPALASSNGVENAPNMASYEGQLDQAAIHMPSNADYRLGMVTKALEGAVSMIDSLDYAYPTFKIFLQQESLYYKRELTTSDKSAKEKRNAIKFKDFSESFDISNIIDIRLVKDEANPADLLVIKMLTTYKDQINRVKEEMKNNTYKDDYDYTKIMEIIKEDKEPGKLTQLEDRLIKAGLIEGNRIQCRLGYDTDPNELNVEFNGKIVAVRGSDILEIYCLGNGEELVQELKGVGEEETYSFNSNTPALFSKILENSPEIVSFGNTSYKSDFLNLEIPIIPAFLGGRSALDNIYAPSLFEEYTEIGNQAVQGAGFALSIATTIEAGMRIAQRFGIGSGRISNKATNLALRKFATRQAGMAGLRLAAGAFSWVPIVGQILVVGAAVATVYEVSRGLKRWLFGSSFTLYNKTVWETMQEMTLRHPGFICSVVPYGNRSTIFFGEPNNSYFHRPPSPAEIGLLTPDSFWNSTVREQLDKNLIQFEDTQNPLGNPSWFVSQSTAGTIERNSKRKDAENYPLATDDNTKELIIMGTTKPFRTYHLVSSEHDIISNDIEVSANGVANSVRIGYPSRASKGNFDGTKGYSDYKISTKLQADDDLYPEYIKEKVFHFDNAHNETVKDMPERYAKAMLCKELKNVYRGTITLLGRPNIKPYDVLIIRDTYTNIFGPVEVAKVVHSLSPHGGWITTVTPAMMVFPDNASGMFQLSLILKAATYWLSDEANIFYTNARRFMPPDDRGVNFTKEEAYAIDYLMGSDYVDMLGDKNQARVSGILGDSRGNQGDFLSNNPTRNAMAYNAANIGISQFTDFLMTRNLPGYAERAIQSVPSIATNAGMILDGNTIRAQGEAALRTAGAVGKTGFMTGFTVARLFAGPAMMFGINFLLDSVVTWSKYRQPIMFFPLKRNNAPWYAALNGFKDNTIIDYFGTYFERGTNRLKFYKEMSYKYWREFKDN